MISIITPAYNGEKFIEFCINNVIEQDCPKIEHIIIDGGSTDNTVNIVKQYADNFSHIRWISEKDRGQSDAMNKGIRIAQGEVIGILNIDDFYEPHTLNHILRRFGSLSEPSLLVGNCNIWDDLGALIKVNQPKRLELLDLLSRKHPFPVNPSAYFYHRSLHNKIGLYDANDHYTMDLDFLLRAVQAANVVYVDEIWGNYRKLSGTKTIISHQTHQHRKNVQKVLQKHRIQLSPIERLQIAIGEQFFYRFRYFSEYPEQIFSSVHNKLKKFKI